MGPDIAWWKGLGWTQLLRSPRKWKLKQPVPRSMVVSIISEIRGNLILTDIISVMILLTIVQCCCAFRIINSKIMKMKDVFHSKPIVTVMTFYSHDSQPVWKMPSGQIYYMKIDYIHVKNQIPSVVINRFLIIINQQIKSAFSQTPITVYSCQFTINQEQLTLLNHPSLLFFDYYKIYQDCQVLHLIMGKIDQD